MKRHFEPGKSWIYNLASWETKKCHAEALLKGTVTRDEVMIGISYKDLAITKEQTYLVFRQYCENCGFSLFLTPENKVTDVQLRQKCEEAGTIILINSVYRSKKRKFLNIHETDGLKI